MCVLVTLIYHQVANQFKVYGLIFIVFGLNGLVWSFIRFGIEQHLLELTFSLVVRFRMRCRWGGEVIHQCSFKEDKELACLFVQRAYRAAKADYVKFKLLPVLHLKCIHAQFCSQLRPSIYSSSYPGRGLGDSRLSKMSLSTLMRSSSDWGFPRFQARRDTWSLLQVLGFLPVRKKSERTRKEEVPRRHRELPETTQLAPCDSKEP